MMPRTKNKKIFAVDDRLTKQDRTKSNGVIFGMKDEFLTGGNEGNGENRGEGESGETEEEEGEIKEKNRRADGFIFG